MIKYECIVAQVKTPDQEETVIIEAPNLSEALIANHEARPGTFVKAIREITE